MATEALQKFVDDLRSGECDPDVRERLVAMGRAVSRAVEAEAETMLGDASPASVVFLANVAIGVYHADADNEIPNARPE